jgi:lactate dehydrogenase-like 2-hydroxyacid dehydrogenase
MTVGEIRDIIPSYTDVSIWSRDRDGELKEVVSGACKSLPEGLNRFDVIILEAPDTDAIDITIDEV